MVWLTAEFMGTRSGFNRKYEIGWGAQAAGLQCLAARQTLSPTIIHFIKRSVESRWYEVFGGPPKTTREPRVLPFCCAVAV